MRLEGLDRLKNPWALSKVEQAMFWFAVQRLSLNKLL
jgi:hypothetical protein